MAVFKFVIIQLGSGWPSGHVAVDEYYGWPTKQNGDNICLTLDAESHDEFCREVDNMIAELEKMKKSTKLKFTAARAKYDTIRKQKSGKI